MNKVFIVFAIVGVLALACGEEEGITRPPLDVPEAASPADVLKNVEKSFNERDRNLLEGMLSPYFIFFFDERDVGQNPPGTEYVIPEAWSDMVFLKAVDFMFGRAYSIDFSVSTGGVGAPAPGETVYEAENVSVSLMVMVNGLSGYVADRGHCDFEFEAYYNGQQQKRWRLTAWRDHTSEYLDTHPGVAPTSFGRLLAFYQVGG